MAVRKKFTNFGILRKIFLMRGGEALYLQKALNLSTCMTSYNILIFLLPCFRINGVTYTFLKTNLLSMFEYHYDQAFNSSNVDFTYKFLCSGGNHIKTQK